MRGEARDARIELRIGEAAFAREIDGRRLVPCPGLLPRSMPNSGQTGQSEFRA